jgi:hypothetical protein
MTDAESVTAAELCLECELAMVISFQGDFGQAFGRCCTTGRAPPSYFECESIITSKIFYENQVWLRVYAVMPAQRLMFEVLYNPCSEAVDRRRQRATRLQQVRCRQVADRLCTATDSVNRSCLRSGLGELSAGPSRRRRQRSRFSSAAVKRCASPDPTAPPQRPRCATALAIGV